MTNNNMLRQIYVKRLPESNKKRKQSEIFIYKYSIIYEYMYHKGLKRSKKIHI